MPARVILKVLSGPIAGKQFEFNSHDTFLFGRHTDCHAQLPKDGFVSRHHFLLEANPPEARIRDLGSLNGIIVNQRKIGGRRGNEDAGQEGPQGAQADLQDGDRIVVGNTQMDVQIVPPVYCRQCSCEIEADTETGADLLCERCSAAGGQHTQAEGTLREPAPSRQVEKTLPESDPADASRPAEEKVENCARCGVSLHDAAEPVAAPDGGMLCCDCQRRLSEETESFHDPDLQLPGFAVERTLGRGGMGVVYLARRTTGRRERVAIKRLLAQSSSNERMRRQFLREMEVNRGLEHERIVRMYESGAVGPEFYFVMEYCRGGSLSQQMRRSGGRLTWSSSLKILDQCLEGLEHAHAQGFVHRDLKPQNVLVGQDQRGAASVKLADFGLAKSFQLAGLSGMTATGAFGGTWHFMPREQLTNFKYVEPASDVWSIAATFYFMVSGRHPRVFPEARDPIEVILHESSLPLRQFLPRAPSKIAKVIDRALSDDLGERFADAAEFRRAFQAAQKGSSSPAGE